MIGTTTFLMYFFEHYASYDFITLCERPIFLKYYKLTVTTTLLSIKVNIYIIAGSMLKIIFKSIYAIFNYLQEGNTQLVVLLDFYEIINRILALYEVRFTLQTFCCTVMF